MPEKREKEIFLQKNFFFSLRSPACGASQRENKKFFAKIFCFLSFRVSKSNTLFISYSLLAIIQGVKLVEKLDVKKTKKYIFASSFKTFNYHAISCNHINKK
jgi:hypothetical protein